MIIEKGTISMQIQPQYSQKEARYEKHKCLNKVPYLGWEKSILYQVGVLRGFNAKVTGSPV